MFKPYAVIINKWGVHVYPAEAFMHSSRLHENKWQYLLESVQDEAVFRAFVPRFEWAVDYAHRKGYGLTQS